MIDVEITISCDDDEVLYCKNHALILNSSKNIENFDPRDWHVNGQNLTCNAHKIPYCDMRHDEYVPIS